MNARCAGRVDVSSLNPSLPGTRHAADHNRQVICGADGIEMRLQHGREAKLGCPPSCLPGCVVPLGRRRPVDEPKPKAARAQSTRRMQLGSFQVRPDGRYPVAAGTTLLLSDPTIRPATIRPAALDPAFRTREGFEGHALRLPEDEMATFLNEPLSRHALAFVLAAGAEAAFGAYRQARQTGGLFRGKIAHHRFCPFQCGELGNPPHRGATQYKAHSLHRHLQMGWNFFAPSGTRASISCRQPAHLGDELVSCTADAVYQTSISSSRTEPDSSCCSQEDHIYKMDYELIAEAACRATRGRHDRLPRDAALGIERFGIMHIDDDGVVSPSSRKPADPPPMPGKPDQITGQHGNLHLDPSSCSTSCGATEMTRTQAMTSQGRHSLYREKRPGGGPSILQLLRQVRR